MQIRGSRLLNTLETFGRSLKKTVTGARRAASTKKKREVEGGRPAAARQLQ